MEPPRFIVVNDRDATLLEKLCAIEETLARLVPLLTALVDRAAPPAAASSIAAYPDLYAAEDTLAPQPGGWRKAFPRRQP